MSQCEHCFENKATHFIMENSFYYQENGICCECHGQCLTDGWHEKGE